MTLQATLNSGAKSPNSKSRIASFALLVLLSAARLMQRTVPKSPRSTRVSPNIIRSACGRRSWSPSAAGRSVRPPAFRSPRAIATASTARSSPSRVTCRRGKKPMSRSMFALGMKRVLCEWSCSIAARRLPRKPSPPPIRRQPVRCATPCGQESGSSCRWAPSNMAWTARRRVPKAGPRNAIAAVDGLADLPRDGRATKASTSLSSPQAGREPPRTSRRTTPASKPWTNGSHAGGTLVLSAG